MKNLILKMIVVALALLGVWHIYSRYISKPTSAAPAPAAKAQGPASAMAGAPPMPPASVEVQIMKEEALRPVDEYIARVEPVQQVTIRPQISGIISSVSFKEGDSVKEGDLLFAIEPDSYRAAVAVREAELAQAEAALTRTKKYFDRMSSVDIRSISKSDLDKAESDYLQAEAGRKLAEAALNLARINLGYTEIRAPISGRIGKAEVTKGNYVSPASQVLAEIVQIAPVRVVFSMTDRAYLAMRRRELAGTAGSLNAKVRLPTGEILTAQGRKDFDDNTLNERTGTMAVRFLFDNPEGLLVPGGYVKILTENADAVKGIKVPQRAVLVDQQGSYVMSADDSGKVSVLRIKTGPQIGTDLMVLSGLKEGDRVIVEGLQKAKPGAAVLPSVVEDGK